jgi:hypothetical protein
MQIWVIVLITVIFLYWEVLVTICVDPWRDDPVYNSDEESNEDEVLHSICCTVYAISLFYNTLREITNIFTFSSLLKTFLGGWRRTGFARREWQWRWGWCWMYLWALQAW